MIRARLFPPLLLLLLPLTGCQVGHDPGLRRDEPTPSRAVNFREASSEVKPSAEVPFPPGLLGLVVAWRASRRIRRRIAHSTLDAVPPDS